MVEMTTQTMNNLDLICFKYGTDIPIAGNDKNENIIQKSLGVLQEDGVFAFYLFIESLKKKDEKHLAEKISTEIGNFLSDMNLIGNWSLDAFKSLGSNLNDLFLAKTLIEKTLIYALYHAKAK
ncbi:MAG: hypothetical protein ACE5K0_10960 [Candidatus Methanofastidiosia archaeon]